MTYSRPDRVGDLIRKEIAEMLQHGDVKDPRVGGLVSITHVTMSPDLRQARVYFSLMGTDEEVEACRVGLESAAGYVRRRLARELRLKHIPALTFSFDDSIGYASHMSEVIKGING